jgi:endogenous inhibitor of DNA gyrase (YacG/DUF329 family)
MTELQKQRITELRGEGKSYAGIADALGISVNTVQSYCRRNNLTGKLSETSLKTTSASSFCKHCGKELSQKPGVKARKFCSDECCAAWWTAHPDSLTRKALYTFTCPACGTAFTAYGNSRRKYCSHACYIKARFGGASV